MSRRVVITGTGLVSAVGKDVQSSWTSLLEGRSGVTRVLYPGLASHPQAELVKRQMEGGSTLVAFEVAGGKAQAFRAMNALRLIDISNNLGDAKSLITHPATTTHQRLKPEERVELGIADLGLVVQEVPLVVVLDPEGIVPPVSDYD